MTGGNPLPVFAPAVTLPAMSALVASPAPLPAACPPPVSVEQYHRMGEYNENGRRTELLRGVVVEKPVKSDLHIGVVEDLRHLVRNALGPDQFSRQEQPLTFVDSEPEPDVAVHAGAPAAFRRRKPRTAVFVIEVAVTTVEKDRAKADLYAEANIPEYWIVMPARGVVEVYTQPQGGRYVGKRIVTVADNVALTPAALPTLRVDLAVLFAP